MSITAQHEGVRLECITKRFRDGTLANDRVSCDVAWGTIRGILGENGAGKTTIMKILAGFYRPDSGTIQIDGILTNFRSPKDAKRAGIGMVHQHFSLIPALTVAENIAIGSGRTPFFLRPRQWTTWVRSKALELGFDIRPDERISQLSIGERQRVEIFRLVLAGARILVLDEPTSILAPQEAESLFTHMRRLAKSGCAIFLVTHKVHHVRQVADNVTVLRRGRVVAEGAVGTFGDFELGGLMAGKPPEGAATERTRRSATHGDPVLEACNVTVPPTMSRCGVMDISFQLCAGEVLGIAGISGNGQDELVDAIVGNTNYSGQLRFPYTDSQESARGALSFIPGDARQAGLALPLTIQENLALRCYDQPPFSKYGILQRRRLAEFARERIGRFDIRPPELQVPVQILSGGNAQKVLIARELAGNPRVIVAVNPTAGLDLTAAALVRRELARHADGQAGILLVSEDIDEVMSVSDRILVIYGGRIVGVQMAYPERRREITLLMGGSSLPDHSVPFMQVPS